MGVVDDRSAAGAVASFAAGGVALLRPQEQVFAGMLTGWRNQQLARPLAFATVEQRERMVRAFAAHAQFYPWLWTAQLVDEWMTDLRAVRGVRASTLRGYQIALRCPGPSRSSPSGSRKSCPPSAARAGALADRTSRPADAVPDQLPVRPLPRRPRPAGRPGLAGSP